MDLSFCFSEPPPLASSYIGFISALYFLIYDIKQLITYED